VLQVVLTPTCGVSGYPRQVIIVDAAETTTVYLTALPTVITLITIIPLGTYNTTGWYIFFRDDATPLVHLSSLMTAVRLSLRSWLTPLESDPASLDWAASLDCFLLLPSRLLHLITGPPPFISLWTDCSLLPSLSLMSCIVGSCRGHHVQRLRCGFNALIVVRTSVATSRPSIS
jgi:hypothetical protein